MSWREQWREQEQRRQQQQGQRRQQQREQILSRAADELHDRLEAFRSSFSLSEDELFELLEQECEWFGGQVSYVVNHGLIHSDE